MRRKWGLVFTLAVLGGAALHFLYDVWPNPLTAVLAPVNESVWEHLKLLDLLLYVLAMGAGFLLAYWLQRRALPGWLCGPLVIAAGVYGAALALFSFAPPDLPIFRP